MNKLSGAVLAASLLLAGQAAIAHEPLPASAPAISTNDAQSVSSHAPDRQADSGPGDIMLLSEEDLAGNRGGQTLILSDQTLQSLVSENLVNGDYNAGDISISEGSLADFTGIGNFVINTGAQSSLQAGMSVTINVANAP